MIDWSRFDELCEEVGADAIEEVVELFLEEVEEVIARLRTGPDPTRLEEDLHFLKGSSLNLGFEAVSALCQAGEKNAAEGRAESVDLAEIISAFESSKACFLDNLPRRLSAA